MPKEFLESITKDGSDLDEDEKQLDELKVVVVKATPSTSRSHERRDDKDCRRCPSRPKPTTRVLDEGVWGVSIQAQQRSSSAAVQQIRVGALSPMPSCLGIGGQTGHPQYTAA